MLVLISFILGIFVVFGMPIVMACLLSNKAIDKS